MNRMSKICNGIVALAQSAGTRGHHFRVLTLVLLGAAIAISFPAAADAKKPRVDAIVFRVTVTDQSTYTYDDKYYMANGCGSGTTVRDYSPVDQHYASVIHSRSVYPQVKITLGQSSGKEPSRGRVSFAGSSWHTTGRYFTSPDGPTCLDQETKYTWDCNGEFSGSEAGALVQHSDPAHPQEVDFVTPIEPAGDCTDTGGTAVSLFRLTHFEDTNRQDTAIDGYLATASYRAKRLARLKKGDVIRQTNRLTPTTVSNLLPDCSATDPAQVYINDDCHQTLVGKASIRMEVVKVIYA